MRMDSTHSPDHAGMEREGRRKILFSLLSVFFFVFASLCALSAGISFPENQEDEEWIPAVFQHGMGDNAIRNTDNRLSSDSSPSTRLNVSRLVQRIQLRPGNQQRFQHCRELCSPLPIWSVEPQSLLSPQRLPYDVLTASSRFQILLKTVLPIRAGPLC